MIYYKDKRSGVITQENYIEWRTIIMAEEINSAVNAEESVDPNSLLGKWRAKAYDQNADKRWLENFWRDYFDKEKAIYSRLLKDPKNEVRGTVSELASEFGITVEEMTGFLDGINDSLKEANPIETMTEDTEVNLVFDTEKLYKNMVDAKADWLYGLPEWNDIYSEEEQHRLYMEQKKSGTIVKPKKIGRNDPCPCGSGKKYKYCCGRNQ